MNKKDKLILRMRINKMREKMQFRKTMNTKMERISMLKMKIHNCKNKTKMIRTILRRNNNKIMNKEHQ